jgi:lysine 2,3-aminomutase
MTNWQQILKKSITTVDQLIELYGEESIDREAVQEAIDKFNLRITPAVLAQIEEAGDAFWQQYVPSPEENEVLDGIVDSLAEDADSPVPNITHRYPDRVLFLISPVCATYCRFCTRRRKVGDPEKIPLNQFESAFKYLREHTEVRDVILSGGDPFMLSDRRLEYFLQKLREIPHIEIIRIHTRIPVHLPERINADLCKTIARYHPIFVNVHFNHPAELTPPTEKARRLPAGLADGHAEGCERRSGDHEGADAEAGQEPRPPVLPLYGRPGRRRRAFPDQRREGVRDHQSDSRLDLRPGGAPLLHRRAGRRRQDPAAPQLHRRDQR